MKLLARLVIFHIHLEDLVDVLAGPVGNGSLAKPMPVSDHDLLKKIILDDIRIIVDIGAQGNAGNLMGRVSFFRKQGIGGIEETEEGYEEDFCFIIFHNMAGWFGWVVGVDMLENIELLRVMSSWIMEEVSLIPPKSVAGLFFVSL